jgi:hypothetical protein
MMAKRWNSGTRKRQSLLGNGTTNTFLWKQTNMQQQRNHGRDVFYAVCAKAI